MRCGVGIVACKLASEQAYGVAVQLVDKPARTPARGQDCPPHSGLKIGVLLSLLTALPLFAVDGVVINGTTTKPQAGVLVQLMQPGSSGMQSLGAVKTDADGKFKIEKDIPPGPAILQAIYQGATYNLVLTPGTPRTNTSIVINESTTDPASAKITQHMILLEPGADKLQINETFLIQNDTIKTYSDPKKGSAAFNLPREANGTAEVTISAPGGMPIRRPAEQTDQPGVFRVNYPVKPGETRFEVRYTMPKTDTFSSKVVGSDAPLRIVTPGAVTIEGTGIEDMGQEPTTQARIYNVKAKEFSAKITGTGSLSAGGDGGGAPADTGDQPQVEEANARIYSRLPWVLGLTFALLAAGGVMLYRKGTA
jgi:hypothetical protein